MQRRTTILFALASTSCIIGEPIGDLPGQGDSGGHDSLDPSSEAEGEVGDGHSSDPDDDGGDTTSSTPTDDGADDTTTGQPALCVHEPSGAEPGSIELQQALDIFAVDVVALDSDVAVFGEGHVRRLNSDLEEMFDVELSAPESGTVYSLRIVAPEDDQIVAAYYDPNGAPEWGAHRWLVGIEDGEIVWDTFLGEGTFAISATPNGTVAVVGATSTDGSEWETTLFEVDRHGDVIRTVPTDIVGNAPLQGASVGPLGDVAAFGLEDGAGWLAHWTADYDANWSNSVDFLPIYSIAHAPDGDLVFAHGVRSNDYALERLQTDQGASEWLRAIAGFPHEVDVDCDGSIVVAGHDGISRRDADGEPRWTTPIGDSPIAVDVDADGNIYALVQDVGSDVLLVKLAGL